MKNLLVCSDLHTEMHRDEGENLIDSLYDKDIDIAVVAGDLGTLIGNVLVENIKMLCDKYPDLVYVTGNHEYYHSSFRRVHEVLGELEQKLDNFHWLNITKKTVQGVSFVGGTLWFPKTTAAMINKNYLNDFHTIKDFEPQVFDYHYDTVKFLEDNVTEDDVVVTHHMPTHRSVADMYKGSKFNCFFACHLDTIIQKNKPKVWIHGHTHHGMNYMYDKTNVVANPHGYPMEPSVGFFDPACIVRV